ncbi:MAG: hypothetical protein H0Z35_11970 [Thermoanaerobacteraceae bacterium]|nr:hypothetical protein [Thermoanaerobacteraceae bacterium]
MLYIQAIFQLDNHEHYDGTGYPHGLKGKNIPLIAWIGAVADSFLISHEKYLRKYCRYFYSLLFNSSLIIYQISSFSKPRRQDAIPARSYLLTSCTR